MSVSHVDMQLACRTKALSLTTTLSTAYSRASTATYVDVNGVVQTAAINVARNADYTTGQSAALVESAVTNLALRSQEFDNAAYTNVGTPVVTANTTVAPDGTTTADTLDDQSAASINGRRQTITVPANTNSYCMSVYVLKTVGTPNYFPIINARLTGGVTVDFNAALQTTTGAVATLGTGTASAISVGNYWRFYASITNGGANTSFLASCYPAGNTTLSATLAAGGVGTNVFWGLQLEVGTVPTSYIPTTSAAVTRAADVGSVFSATAQGYARDTGSFLADNYEIGTQIRPVGFVNTTPDTLTNVTALTLTTRSAHPVEAGQLGRNFTVGLPSDFAWENLRFTPTQGVPYVKEEYLPGPMSLNSFGTGGDITVEPTYRLTVFVPQNSGISADGDYADAILNLFAPSTEMLLPDGNVLFVRADVAPIRGQRTQQQGLTGIPVTIPLRALIANADTTNPFYVIFTDVDGDIAISSSITAALANYQTVVIDSGGDPAAP